MNHKKLLIISGIMTLIALAGLIYFGMSGHFSGTVTLIAHILQIAVCILLAASLISFLLAFFIKERFLRWAVWISFGVTAAAFLFFLVISIFFFKGRYYTGSVTDATKNALKGIYK